MTSGARASTWPFTCTRDDQPLTRTGAFSIANPLVSGRRLRAGDPSFEDPIGF
jgi:hypothetical protein